MFRKLFMIALFAMGCVALSDTQGRGDPPPEEYVYPSGGYIIEHALVYEVVVYTDSYGVKGGEYSVMSAINNWPLWYDEKQGQLSYYYPLPYDGSIEYCTHYNFIDKDGAVGKEIAAKGGGTVISYLYNEKTQKLATQGKEFLPIK